ncbi:MAG: D-tyrosyl-tRNA(Tyr) deacylase [Deltaproteobacteria bacterium]|uniref:D-aminoacyl-tRNA deacylase n=1 Tax=Candidatus Zymogenus saltonus TaxID=2844893 RepID=A0A9D8KGI9_9DELT|nr:D-tyrosyl-tRNA(Tyr) deacylase [Candidatus Zymogenus saltonus]
MLAVIQRTSEAKVTVKGKTVGEIGRGLLVLLGVERGDTAGDADYLLDKIINLRIFEDGDLKMNLSLIDVKGELLVVSQFTLLGDVRKGRRPSFVNAEEPGRAKDLYEYFIGEAKGRGVESSGGVFQAMMDVSLINDGPVTLIVDSRKRF